MIPCFLSSPVCTFHRGEVLPLNNAGGMEGEGGKCDTRKCLRRCEEGEEKLESDESQLVEQELESDKE